MLSPDNSVVPSTRSYPSPEKAEQDKERTPSKDSLRDSTFPQGPCEAPEGTRSWLSSVSGRALTYLALSMPIGAALLNPATAEAAQNNPIREKAVKSFGEESWSFIKKAIDERKDLSKVPNIDQHWNNIQAVMHVTDNTAVAGLDKMRLEIIERGATNPQIPARIVHGALYTMAVLGQQLNNEMDQNRLELVSAKRRMTEIDKQGETLQKLSSSLPADVQKERQTLDLKSAQLELEYKALAERRSAMSASAIPYLGSTIVDTTTKEGRQQRHLVAPGQVEELAKAFPMVSAYDGKDFHRLAAFVIGQVNDTATLERASKELLNAGNNIERRNMFLDVFLYGRRGAAAPAPLLEEARLNVFGREQLEAYKKSLEPKKAETPPAAIVAPSSGGATSVVLVNQPSASAPASVNLTIPGVPSGAKAGALDALHQIDAKLVAPKMQFPFAKDQVSQDFVANNILLLAKNRDELARVAASQWFAEKHCSEGLKGATKADFTVLEALAICAQKDQKSFEVLKRVGASFPEMFVGDTLLVGSASARNTPATRANAEVVKALTTYPDEARKWFSSVAETKAPLLWPVATAEEEVKVHNGIRDKAKGLALRSMALLDMGNGFVDSFREILKNPLAQESDLNMAIIGVALAKDKQSIETLLEKGLGKGQNLSRDLRALALEAAVFIDTPNAVPDAVLKKAAQESPFSAARIHYFFPLVSNKAGDMVEPEYAALKKDGFLNPFHARLTGNYDNWLAQENLLRAAGNISGQEPTAVGPAEKLTMMLTLMRREFSGHTGAIAERAQKNADFREKFLDPMVRFLEDAKDSKTPLDLSLAAPMMAIIDKAGHSKASALFANMAAYPERYVTDASLPWPFSARQNGTNAAVLKATALEHLGGAVDLTNADDVGAQVLHRVVRKNSSRIYRDAASLGLQTLAERYDDALKAAPGGSPERTALIEARSKHAKECIEHMQYHRQGLESAFQSRLAGMFQEFKYAKLADNFGATKELLKLADAAANSDLKTLTSPAAQTKETDMRPVLIRSVMHALYSNGHKVEEIKGMGFDDATSARLTAMFNYVNNQEYWLGKSEDRKFTGKGREAAVFDVGYALPLEVTGGMKDKLIYPEGLIRWTDLARSDEVHPTMVAWTIHRAAQDAKIRTYNVNAQLREVEFRPADTQDAIFRAFEHLSELQLAGMADVDVVNYSFGFPNVVMNDAAKRAEFVDQMSAFMEVLSKMDVRHSVAAANSHGADPRSARFAGIGEVNNLGLRWNRESNDFTQPDSVFIAAGHDAYTQRMAEFSSKADELRDKEAPKLRAFHGVHAMLPDIENNRWVMVPGNGTSFSAPNESAMLLWGAEAAKAAGIEPLTHKQWQEVFERSIRPMVGREPQEGGGIFSLPLFLDELKKFTERR